MLEHVALNMVDQFVFIHRYKHTLLFTLVAAIVIYLFAEIPARLF